MKTCLGSGRDEISSCMLKASLPVISSSLCHIFNFSILSSFLPDYWNTARVSPILKEGTKSDGNNNYRPIPVLPVIPRLFEKFVYNQLHDYLDANMLLSSRQSGFRSLHSVVTCLQKCTDDWHINMDNCHYIAVAFIDLKKTFDTMDHSILWKKMSKYGSKGNEMEWFRSYLQPFLYYSIRVP